MNFPLVILGNKEFGEASDSVQQLIFSGINDPFLMLVDPKGINGIVVRLLKMLAFSLYPSAAGMNIAFPVKCV